ncbi:uncharacterized protein LOC131215596 [Anopheles bellator]|uniref:uncharacterized protein LOC131215596 n=1 Tax=Anopheles bellator TaxID=139047 RepID=UPI00264752E1|nr:uncharacterized protein LOC131215596 [Anopheles bellator]
MSATRSTKKKNRWSTTSLELLVRIWSQYYNELKTSRTHDKIYARMRDDLVRLGVRATVDDVRCRIQNLAVKFKKEAAVAHASGLAPTWPLFYRIGYFMEFTLPERPRSEPPGSARQTNGVAPSSGLDLPAESAYINEEHLDEEYLHDKGDGEVLVNGMVDAVDQAEQGQEQPPEEPEPQKQRRNEKRSPAKETASSSASCSFVQEPTIQATPEPTSDTDNSCDDETGLYQIKGMYRQQRIDDFFCKLYSNHMLTDVTLIACHGGDTVMMPAHRIVLANLSSYFATIFEKLTPTTLAGSLAIMLPLDISPATMQLLLQYMYTGKMHITQDTIDDVWRCGTQLKIQGFWSESRGEPNKRPTLGKKPHTERMQEEGPQQEQNQDFEEEPEPEEEQEHGEEPEYEEEQEQMLETHESSRGEAKRRNTYEGSPPRKKRPRPPIIEDTFSDLEMMEVSSAIGRDLLLSNSDDDEDDSPAMSNDDRDESDDDAGNSSRGQLHKKSHQEDEYYGCDNYFSSDSDSDDYGNDYDDLDEDEDEGEDEGEDEESYDDGYEDTTDTDTIQNDVVDRDGIRMEDDEGEDNIMGSGANVIQNGIGIADGSIVDDDNEEQGLIVNNEGQNEQPTEPIRNGVEEPESLPPDPSFSKLETSDLDPARALPLEEQTIRGERELSEPDPAVLEAATTLFNAQTTNRQWTHRNGYETPESIAEGEPLRIDAHRDISRLEEQNISFSEAATTNTSWTCKLCSFRFPAADVWIQHVVQVHGNDTHILCRKKIEKRRVVTMLDCDLCKVGLNTEYDWVRHILTRHTELYPHLYMEQFASVRK